MPLQELELRWEIEPGHEYEPGIPESMSIDQTKHSLFGASKVAADVLVQEYGRYFGMPTACFRGGCLTGPAHAGTELHGFLSFFGTAGCYRDLNSFFCKSNCGCPSNTRTATCYDRNFLICHLFYIVLALFIVGDTNTPNDG